MMFYGFSAESDVHKGAETAESTQGGDFPQSLPVCVVKIWREMGPFSNQSGTGGVHRNVYVLGVILQYGYNI